MENPNPKFPRLDSLDLLRGIAILGIFLMNTQDMSMPVLAYYNPLAYDAAAFVNPGNYHGLSSLNYAVFIVIHVVADLKFLTVFSTLFGAGILLQGERLLARGASPVRVHYLRMAVLLIFGLIHAHLFWYGDVLAEYAMCGMLLFPLRKLRARALVVGGLCMLTVATLYHWSDTHNVNISVVHWLHRGTARLTNGVTGNDFEFRAYSGAWRQQMRTRFWVALDNQTFSFLDWTLWRSGGSMLIGMGLLKLRFFHCEWRRRAYPALAAVCIPAGWAISPYWVWFTIRRRAGLPVSIRISPEWNLTTGVHWLPRSDTWQRECTSPFGSDPDRPFWPQSLVPCVQSDEPRCRTTFSRH